MTTSERPGPALAPGRRERKKSEQRRNLQVAALRLADEHGYKRLTVESIADAADVSTRTFFNYFSSKDAALLSPGPDVLRALVTNVIARPADESALSATRAVLRASAVHVGDDVELWRARMRIVDANPHLMAGLSSSFYTIERALAVGIGRRLGTDSHRDPYTLLVASCACAALRVALMQWQQQPDEQLPQRLDDLFDLLADGLTRRPDVALVRAAPHTASADPLMDLDELTCRTEVTP